MMDILYTLKSFKGIIRKKHVQVLTDNTCAVSYISNMGGSRSPDCNDITRQIWMWGKENAVWISVSHIPGIKNTEADVLSRQFNDRTEWKLSPDIFHKVTDRLLKPDIDLFASHLNFQMKPFISWGPDPAALAINAFTKNWSKWLIYAFPHTAESTFQVAERQGRRDPDCPRMTNGSVVPPNLEDVDKRACSSSKREAYYQSTSQGSCSSSTQEAATPGLRLIRKSLEARGV